MSNSTDCIQVTTLLGDRAAADALAERLVAERMAACVQVLGPVTSTYRWQGQIESAQEWMCLIKTTNHRYADVERLVRHEHSYEQPEIIALPIVAGSAGYLDWVRSQVDPGSEQE